MFDGGAKCLKWETLGKMKKTDDYNKRQTSFISRRSRRGTVLRVRSISIYKIEGWPTWPHENWDCWGIHYCGWWYSLDQPLTEEMLKKCLRVSSRSFVQRICRSWWKSRGNLVGVKRAQGSWSRFRESKFHGGSVSRPKSYLILGQLMKGYRRAESDRVAFSYLLADVWRGPKGA